MGLAYTLIAIIAPVLLLGTIIYVWWQNRKEGPDAVRKADRGARELQHEEGEGAGPPR